MRAVYERVAASSRPERTLHPETARRQTLCARQGQASAPRASAGASPSAWSPPRRSPSPRPPTWTTLSPSRLDVETTQPRKPRGAREPGSPVRLRRPQCARAAWRPTPPPPLTRARDASAAAGTARGCGVLDTPHAAWHGGYSADTLTDKRLGGGIPPGFEKPLIKTIPRSSVWEPGSRAARRGPSWASPSRVRVRTGDSDRASQAGTPGLRSARPTRG